MAMWLFTEAILAGRAIKVFNHGRMKRDFTFIDDIVQGVLATLDAPPRDDGQSAPQRLYNIGNNHPESLLDMIAVLEDALGQTASKEFLPLQPGDVPQTSADITAIQRDHGFQPRTTIAEGIPRFVDWYKSYRGL
jgi:UDP-glucuronate 4-epimerase